MVIVAIIGLPGAGKTEVTQEFIKAGFTNIYFPQILFDILNEKGLPHTQEHERPLREQLRKEHGMEAFAKLNLQRIKAAHAAGPVSLESMYSWEEYLLLKKEFGNKFITVAVWSPPKLRQERLSKRPHRPLTAEQTLERDHAQIESLHQAGPIAMAEYLIINTKDMDDLRRQAQELATTLFQV